MEINEAISVLVIGFMFISGIWLTVLTYLVVKRPQQNRKNEGVESIKGKVNKEELEGSTEGKQKKQIEGDKMEQKAQIGPEEKEENQRKTQTEETKDEQANEPEMVEEEVFECPVCGFETQLEDSECPRCGVDLAPEEE
ncbi:MAG: hypothetical protein JSW00_02630 [Thermoplasmata archaeon]|nr:MAG: hypothetical protein JSW00_02630 [Thermoplasmata archaeon]